MKTHQQFNRSITFTSFGKDLLCRRHPAVFAVLIWAIAFAFSLAHAADHYITVIDLSGSMNAKERGEDGKEYPRLDFVRNAVESDIQNLPNDSFLTMIGFNKGIVAQVSTLPMSDPESRRSALKWVNRQQAPDNSKTYLWTTTEFALGIAREIQEEDPSATIYVRILTDGEDTEEVTTFSRVIDKFPEVDGKSLHVDFLTLGIELSIPPRKGVTVTPVFDWEEIFPPIIHHFPEAPRVGDEVSLFFKAPSKYDRVEWEVDKIPFGEDSKITLIAPAGDGIAVTLNAYRGEDVRVTRKRISVLPPELEAVLTLIPNKGTVGEKFHAVSRSIGNIQATTIEVLDEVGETVFSSDNAELVFVPERPGTYRVVHTIEDASGEYSDETQKKLIVSPQKIEAGLVIVPEEVGSGEDVRVVDRSVGDSVSTSVDFGDGSEIQTEAPFRHTYENLSKIPKEFTVEITVRDKFGQTSTAEQVVTVLPSVVPELLAKFSLVPEEGVAGDEFHLLSRSKGRIDSSAFEVFDEKNQLVFSNESPEVVYVPDVPGIYRVVHTVRDTAGHSSDTTEKTFTVSVGELTADFVVVPEEVHSGDPIRVVDRSTGAIVGHTIDFGDGSDIQTDPPYLHSYKIAGEVPEQFTIELTVSDKFGHSSTKSHEVTVLPAILPEVRFSIGTEEENRFAGAPILFLNESEHITSWRWLVDGVEVENAARNPSIEFPEAGRYSVILEASGGEGEDPIRFEKEVVIVERYDDPKITEIRASESSGRVPFEMTVTADVEGDYETLIWTLPGGETLSGEEEITLFFDQPGEHTISLEVIGKGNLPEKVTSAIEVEAKLPVSKWITIGLPALFGAVVLSMLILTLFQRFRDRELSGKIIVEGNGADGMPRILEGREFSLRPFGAPEYSIRYLTDEAPGLFRKDRKVKTLVPNKVTTAGKIKFRYLRS